MYARIPLDRRTFKINILIGAGPRHSDTHTLHFDVTLLIDAYRLRTIKKHDIGNSVLYLVIAPKEEAVVRGLTTLREGIHLSDRKLLGY